jgi:tRNA(Ile)-lysidine synthase
MSLTPAATDHSPLGDAEAAAIFSTYLAGADNLLIAVSGGPDSMALLALLAAWAQKPKLAAATVDHGLRAESAVEAVMVAGFCQRLGIPHATLHWTGEKPASGLQETARDARYALLAHHAHDLGLRHLVTAHHADDQAETVLMRLIAGSGIGGLSGMRAQVLKDGMQHVRPLLAIPKARLVATCQASNIPFVEDPSNSNERFGRTRIRRVMTGLKDEGLTAERLTRLAARAARADKALDAATSAALKAAGVRTTDCVVQIDWLAVADAPQEIRLRVLESLLLGSKASVAPLKLERLEALLDAIDIAASRKARLRRSIADRIVTLQSHGRLSITAAPPRRRGMDLDP